jgi:preprotein translocase subunit SecE
LGVRVSPLLPGARNGLLAFAGLPQYLERLASGPVTDFRGDPISQKDPLSSVSSSRLGTAEGYLKSKMAKTSPLKFFQEVRTETEKVTWPTRRETMITTAMVFVMVALSSIFFLIADQIIRFVVTLVLGIGS